MAGAAEQLLGCYGVLAGAGRHLLDDLITDQPVVQWEHYPVGDVIDRTTGFQYYYHAHPPEDRAVGMEHGHFHLFARLDGDWHQRDAVAEDAFLARFTDDRSDYATAHLLAVSVDAKGVPREIFTVNQWVTDDRLLTAAGTLALLDRFAVTTTGPELLNRWLGALLRLFRPQVDRLLQERDQALAAANAESVLCDQSLEVLSRAGIDIDRQIAELNSKSA